MKHLHKYIRKKANVSRNSSIEASSSSKSSMRTSSSGDLSPGKSSVKAGIAPLCRSQYSEIQSESSSSSSGLGQKSSIAPEELRDVFRYIDSNGDGKISACELAAVLRSLGDNPTDEELNVMMREVDADGDGFIDLDEFINLNAGNSIEELKAAFYVFDADRNGYISAEELYQVLVRLGEKGLTMEDCSRMIGGVDSDGDGFVDFEEFKKMMIA